MDPITHTFTGAALAAAGLRRATPLATAALLIGANAPDVDALSYFADGFEAVAFRRGWTHGVLALALWPFVLTGSLLLWDRWVRRRRAPHAAPGLAAPAGAAPAGTAPANVAPASAAPARAGPLLAVAALAVLTHPTLDWLNNYGLRWLMPFDGRWFYGDALFIIDPWLWLLLGGVLFLAHSNGRGALATWTAFWALASVALLATPLVPATARVLWIVGLGVLAAARSRRYAALRREAAMERAAVAALAIVAVYVCATVGASAAARAQVRADLAARGIAGVERVMVAPAAANPLAGDVVAATADLYYTGRWNWLARPRLELARESLPRPRGAVFDAAARAPDARRFLSWARFPVVEVEPGAEDGGPIVRFSDARYRTTGRLGGPTVRLDRDLRLR